MLEWCMFHPWMTLFLIFVSMLVIDNVVSNICKAIGLYIERKYGKKETENNG